jgi:hypothetical protein
MSGAFEYKPRFKDIRVRPPKEGEQDPKDVYSLKPGEKPCEWPDCRKAASARAPKSRDMLHEHYWFCQGHAAEYNKNWDFFTGMTESDVAAAQAARAVGERPTWQFKASRLSREAASFANGAAPGSARGSRYRDPMGLFTDAASGRPRAAPTQKLGRLEHRALIELDLDEGADAGTIRVRYLDLVKRCHPDSNGGDRSAEDKLQRVLKAYKVLRAAKLV